MVSVTDLVAVDVRGNPGGASSVPWMGSSVDSEL